MSVDQVVSIGLALGSQRSNTNDRHAGGFTRTNDRCPRETSDVPTRPSYGWAAAFLYHTDAIQKQIIKLTQQNRFSCIDSTMGSLRSNLDARTGAQASLMCHRLRQATPGYISITAAALSAHWSLVPLHRCGLAGSASAPFGFGPC